ncbi:hypothetical protein [Leptospira santarosai]|uniref:Transposase domain protein n=1 Tax=Leptospira santarosai str. ZUN179 TaxID=1049985 RepID=M6UPX9_9LEPT|nr:hypothetical protein [Leptospira santarosai]EMO47197.1 hypothetical protein LEP1GSC187_1207 [Leptospira santarosai str. ZUN179]
MKRKVYVGMNVHKETIPMACLTSNSKALVKEPSTAVWKQKRILAKHMAF